MEVVYSIGVSNRFLLDMDTVSDPQDIFVEKEQRMKEKKEKSSKPKQPKPIKKAEPVKKAPEPEQKSRKEDSRPERSDRPDGGRRGGGRGGRGGNQDRPNSNYRRNNNRRSGEGQDGQLENQENQAPSEFRSSGGSRPPREYQGDRPPRGDYQGDNQGDRAYRGGGRGRGRGGPRGGRGGFGGRGGSSEYRGKREFDRHSGSDKRDLNTSNTSEEPTNPEYIQPVDGEQTENAPKKTPKEGEENEAALEDGEDKEPEKDEMTLDEYKAMVNKERVKTQFKIRQAGEGEDNSQWKPTYVLKKETTKDDADKHGEVNPKEHNTKPDAAGLINFTFADQPGSGRGRGARRGRGAGGRGGERGGEGRMERDGERRGERGGERDGDRRGDRGGAGGRGRGGDRMPRGAPRGGRGGRYRDDSAIAVDNEEEFPSLSK
ncbi:TATA-binding protein-associated factor 2N isoform X3 [Strongylocentrotus purpuratus]|uniref:Hyaluronan/mRNA-binding protein domain-containing protein n=1 Tax=Strongylocentrotus purpuratus TaxID=7668 RepID=A0A7M7PIZ1_STRPU|nr:TATA-binding protein-associated factor 2N isoform X3 [Strongylocentrotus purpuratus]